MAKLAPTAECAIAITFLVMNLERLLQLLLFVFCEVVVFLKDSFDPHLSKRHSRQWQLAIAQ